MRDPEAFGERRDEAEQAAVIVERIRQDEASHVAYLTAVVSELRSFMFKTGAGKAVAGAEFIDPVWRGMVNWHAVTNVEFERARTHKALCEALLAQPGGRELVAQFETLSEEKSGTEAA
jgi:hypothetical protein